MFFFYNLQRTSSIQVKHAKEIDSLSLFYKSQVIELENQLQKQRDRTLALLDEKEQEVSTLKSSFQIFLPGNKKSSDFPQVKYAHIFI